MTIYNNADWRPDILQSVNLLVVVTQSRRQLPIGNRQFNSFYFDSIQLQSTIDNLQLSIVSMIITLLYKYDTIVAINVYNQTISTHDMANEIKCTFMIIMPLSSLDARTNMKLAN